jgi:RimJ/RimL family protein N-acetyltransferase
VSKDHQISRLPKRELSGAPVNSLPPALYPPRIPIEGQYARLEPVDPRVHTPDLFRAGHTGPESDDVWTYMAYGPFASESVFAAWLRDCAASADPVYVAIADLSHGRFTGMASLMDIQPKAGAIEIGHIWLGPELQRTRAATEAIYLLMAHAMDDLGYRRLQWKCNALNEASRSAAERLGFEFEGVLFQHQIPKGNNRDTAYYSILDYEWLLIRQNFQRWLDPANFDESGVQKVSLGDLNRALRGE